MNILGVNNFMLIVILICVTIMHSSIHRPWLLALAAMRRTGLGRATRAMNRWKPTIDRGGLYGRRGVNLSCLSLRQLLKVIHLNLVIWLISFRSFAKQPLDIFPGIEYLWF